MSNTYLTIINQGHNKCLIIVQQCLTSPAILHSRKKHDYCLILYIVYTVNHNIHSSYLWSIKAAIYKTNALGFVRPMTLSSSKLVKALVHFLISFRYNEIFFHNYIIIFVSQKKLWSGRVQVWRQFVPIPCYTRKWRNECQTQAKLGEDFHLH